MAWVTMEKLRNSTTLIIITPNFWKLRKRPDDLVTGPVLLCSLWRGVSTQSLYDLRGPCKPVGLQALDYPGPAPQGS